MENRNAALPAFLVGLGAGIVVTLLMTPLSGTALRSGIGRKLKDGTDWVEGKATAAKAEVLSQAEGLRDRAQAVVGAVTHG